MPYSVKKDRTPFKSGKNILASSHLQFKEVGGTMDAEAFPVGLIEVGTCIVKNNDTGKYEPYADGEEGGFPGGFSDPVILNVDFENDGTNDTIVGELIIRGSVYEPKLIGVTEAFKEKLPMVRFV